MATQKNWRFLLEAMFWPKLWMLRQDSGQAENRSDHWIGSNHIKHLSNHVKAIGPYRNHQESMVHLAFSLTWCRSRCRGWVTFSVCAWTRSTKRGNRFASWALALQTIKRQRMGKSGFSECLFSMSSLLELLGLEFFLGNLSSITS